MYNDFKVSRLAIISLEVFVLSISETKIEIGCASFKPPIPPKAYANNAISAIGRTSVKTNALLSLPINFKSLIAILNILISQFTLRKIQKNCFQICFLNFNITYFKLGFI